MHTTIFGDRVRQARVLRRLTRSDVASRMKWAAATQTRLERTETKVLECGTAELLARTLRVSCTFLETRPTFRLRVSDLRFRTPKSTTQQEKDYMVEFAQLAGELYSWLDEKHRFPPLRIPRIGARHSPYEAARMVRDTLGVPIAEPIDYLVHSVERAGVVVVTRTPPSTDDEIWDRSGDTWIERPYKGERHFGYTTWVGAFNERPLVVLRAIDSWERTRWTVAHELGHIALHHSEVPDDAELAASSFANELLAPAESLKKELGTHVTLSDLVQVKLKWGISVGALIRHLHVSELIGDERAATLSKQLYVRKNPATGRSWGRDEPGWDDRKVERPRALTAWAERCVGTSAAGALSNIDSFWQDDLMHSILNAQRRPTKVGPPAPKGGELLHVADTLPRRQASGEVISLFDWRQD